MKKSTSQKIKVGVFIVVGTILLIAALYYIGKKQHMFTKNIELYSVFENVNGLILGNNVRYSGVNIGTVSKIEMLAEGKIIVGMSVVESTSVFIKKDAIASISSDGLVGSMVVNIVPGIDEAALKVASGDTLQISDKLSTDDMLSTLSKTNENVALLSADLLKITNQIVAGKGTLGALLSDSLMGTDIKQSAQELRKMTSGATHAINRINAIISKINYDESAAAVILSDTAAKNQITKVIANLETSSKDVNAITKNLDIYINEIKSGKGALNHITQDENFVRQIDSTMIQIKEASEKLNQNMEALQHNFFFRGFFKKQEKQRLKEAKEK